MYLPILRGRQYELIAIRELVEGSLLSDYIIPIIEPVKLSPTLIKTLEVFRENNRKIAIIHNPKVGNLNLDILKCENENIAKKFNELIKEENVIYTCYLNQNVEAQIGMFENESASLETNMIAICEKKDDILSYEKLYSLYKPKYTLVPDERMFRKHIKENCVLMDDKFNKQNRNTDYAAMDDEHFSDDHIDFMEDGYLGFADYSIIGNEYIETGFAPYAVAIHIVYFSDDKSLRIKHFVSDTNEDISDPAGKFAEAVKKLVEWENISNINTSGVTAFIDMYNKNIYPGLGTVKKLSLMHHIELIGQYLDEVRDDNL